MDWQRALSAARGSERAESTARTLIAARCRQARCRQHREIPIGLCATHTPARPLAQPTWSTSRFGTVDIVRDYQSLFKPCVLAAKPGGTILATNHVSTVDEVCPGLRNGNVATSHVSTVDEQQTAPDATRQPSVTVRDGFFSRRCGRTNGLSSQT